MQLPDESIDFDYKGSLVTSSDSWTLLAELQKQHFVTQERFDALKPQLINVRMQMAAEREPNFIPSNSTPKLLESGFIDLPHRLLDQHRRKGPDSELGGILESANRLKGLVDRVVILGSGGGYSGPRALFESLCNTYHNDLPTRNRLGIPRIYFEGNSADNDALQELLDLFENTCVDPDIQEECWGAVLICKDTDTLETASAYRVIRNEMARFYGSKSDAVRPRMIPITAPSGKIRTLLTSEGYSEDEIFTIPDNINSRFSLFTAAGLIPAALMGLDVRALLLGASTMTRRFLEEPIERNPVLQFAAINYLLAEEHQKKTRVVGVWSKKLEALGWWYSHLVCESLGKETRGVNSMTVVMSRDLHSVGQQLQEGLRDKIIHNFQVKTYKHPPIAIGMADHNQDDLNAISRKTMPDILDGTLHELNRSAREVARPTTNITLPVLSEHTIGQLMQMLMLSTIVEGRLMGINPYGQPSCDRVKSQIQQNLRANGQSR